MLFKGDNFVTEDN